MLNATGGGDVRDTESASRVFRSILRLLSSWTARPVMQLYLDRAGVDLDPTDFEVLLYIGHAGPVMLRDLAVATNMTASNASKIVAELVAAGLVTRTVPAGDRRVTLLEVTDRGGEAVARLDRTGREMTAERLAGFSSEEIDTLATLLGRLATDVAGWSARLATGDADEGSPTARRVAS